MLRTLKDLLDALKPPSPTQPDATTEHTLQLATAVMLVEIMRSEPDIGAEERDAVIQALREKFALADDELARLVELAEQASREAYDYHRFTSAINRGFSPEQKARIIEYMWQVAYADGYLSAHENHLMRKIADLLYIPHAVYVQAKMRGRDRAHGAGKSMRDPT